ncbi:MAG: GGDEF domain-containing protein [Terracidiphilus sp.]
MISIKKYLDMDLQELPAAGSLSGRLDEATMECYRSALSCIGANATRIYPGIGADLESRLRGLGNRLSVTPTVESLALTETQVEVLVGEWGERTSDHFKGKADEVKELLIALAKAAESVGNKDEGYSLHFNELIGRLEQIADLDDLTKIRSSIVERVTELRDGVDQMARASNRLVTQLKAEVSTYETRLKSVEHLAYRDELTMVANRRSIEERMRSNIASKQPFCVVMLDLNHFKHVNDKYGHVAGDELLKQFARELQMNARSGDLVGRWGGDEFLLLLCCDEVGAQSHIKRIRDWVFGKYTIQAGADKTPIEVQLDASVGVADWHSGESIEQVIENADKAMYLEKNRSRMQPA